jgi:hypothetical protein
MGDYRTAAHAHSNLAEVTAMTGDLEAAGHHLRACLRIRRDIGSAYWIAASLDEAAGLVSELGRAEAGPRLLGAAEAVRRDGALSLTSAEQTKLTEVAGGLRAALGDAAFEASYAEGLAMTMDEAIAYALDEVLAEDGPTEKGASG